ncbi:enhancer of split M1 protein-like [Lucilia sericata]|uniref:enhancer of split M1 protein-like n=1 Tax=Lucilia sericata TaxID=13632 RepID=UPI0018A7F5FE|nr:enhancer of split M1 protein-like [Lucilia sericata]
MQFTSCCISLLMGLFLVVGVIANEETDCKQFCPRIYLPVCGTIKNSEGENVKCNFANECMLEIFTCRTKQELIKEKGHCDEEFSGCEDLLYKF